MDPGVRGLETRGDLVRKENLSFSNERTENRDEIIKAARAKAKDEYAFLRRFSSKLLIAFVIFQSGNKNLDYFVGGEW